MNCSNSFRLTSFFVPTKSTNGQLGVLSILSIRQRGMPSEDTSIHSLPSILVSYRALSRLAHSFCSISVFSFFMVTKKADRFLLSICLCIGYLLFGSSSLSAKGKRRFYICVLVQRKIAVWAAKKPDIIGLSAGDICFVSTLWSEC